MNWDDYPNFKAAEFDCKQTGENGMTPEFMARLQALRIEFGVPMFVNSGYRSPRHSIEARKAEPGAHASGRACDIRIQGDAAYRLIELAIKHGFTGIGVQQKGASRFIHLDDLESAPNRPRPWVWSY